MKSEKSISIVIPNYNSADTIGTCLEAIFSSDFQPLEVIVVDDCSRDNSLDIIKKYPCRVIELREHKGTSGARNAGGFSSNGDVIFFTDADCVLNKDTLSLIYGMLPTNGPDVVIGGTYDSIPYDRGFFNQFQAVFVNYSETRVAHEPDYIAAHLMIINAETFRRSGGYPEEFLPILEDVEFSHRLRREGCSLLVNPKLQVRHIFNFTLIRSIRNAIRKSRYWTVYNLMSGNLFVDSGSSSTELKSNVVSAFLIVVLSLISVMTGMYSILIAAVPVILLNIFINRKQLTAFYHAGGLVFAVSAGIYYTIVYAASVGAGTIAGLATYFFSHRFTQIKNSKVG